MLSVAESVQILVKQSPYLTDALSLGIVNLSALARNIHDQVEKSVKKTIKTGAIIVALKRLSQKISKEAKKMKKPLDFDKMTIRSNLVEFTYANSETLLECEKNSTHELLRKPEAFFNISKGIHQTTIILSASISNKVAKIYEQERLISSFENLASITINLPQETVITPGAYYSILRILAWEGINLVEVASTYTELTLLFRNEDVDRAFSTLKNRLITRM